MRFVVALIFAALIGGLQAQTLDFQRSHVPPPAPLSVEQFDVASYGSGWILFGKVGFEGILIRFDNLGNQIAVRRFFPPQNGQISANGGSLAVNQGNGDIWIAYEKATSKTNDITVMKFNGNLALQAALNIDRGGDDKQPDICVGPANCALVVFSQQAPPNGAVALELVRVEANGTQTFVQNYRQNAAKNTYVREVLYDPLFQMVYVSGVVGDVTSADYTLVSRFNPSTGQLLSNLFPYTEAPNNTLLRAMRLTTDGKVRVTGQNWVGGQACAFLATIDPNAGFSVSTESVAGYDAYEDGLDTFGTNLVNLFSSPYQLRYNNTLLPTPTDFTFDVKHFGAANRFAVGRRADSNGQREVAQVYSGTGLIAPIYSSSFSKQGRKLVRVGTNEMVVTTSDLNGGQTFNFIQFNSEGVKAFEYNEDFNGPSPADVLDSTVDRDCAYVAYGDRGRVFRLMKVGTAGTVEWDRNVDGQGQAAHLAVNGDRQVAVLGQWTNTSSVVSVFDPTGSSRWVATVAGVPAGGIAYGGDGSLYVATRLDQNIYNSSDIRVVKFGPSGNVIWTRTYDSGGQNEKPEGIVVTPSGYVVVAASSVDTQSFAMLLVLDANGNFHWVQKFYFGTSGFVYGGMKLALQPNGLITFGMGSFESPSYKVRLTRVDAVRKMIMADSTFSGTSNEIFYDVAVSPAGTAYLAQSSASSRGLVQFNTSGAVAWVRTLPSGVLRILDVATDAQNSVYVLAFEGYTDSAGGFGRGVYFVKYNTLGQLVTDRRIRGSALGLDADGHSIAMGSVFDLWVTSNVQTTPVPGLPTVTRYLQPVAPTALGETYTVVKGQTLTIAAPGVLANDSDLNGDSLTCSILSNPAQGTLTLQNTGAFTYIAPATAGLRSFKYTVRDSTGRTTIAQCNINVTN